MIEGTTDPVVGHDTRWVGYKFKAKLRDPTRRPRQVAPDHLRLDCLM